MAVPGPKDVFYRPVFHRASVMDRKLLDILVCPATRQPLAPVAKPALQQLNQAIVAGTVKRVDDVAQAEAIDAALITRDGKRLYRVEDDIPVLLAEEAILTDQVPGFG